MADVFFIDVRTDNSLLAGLGALFDKAFPDLVAEGDLTAIKMHFGEYGNTGFIRSIYIRKIVDKIKEKGGEPFLTDANTLYKGMRHNAVEHLRCASMNGFTMETTGAPLIIADGLHGHSYKEVEIGKGHFKTVKIGAELAEADSLFVVSHFKGHMSSGFGGAIKNLGMGGASRAGKQQQHSSTKPVVDAKKCITCKRCGRICPEGAFSYDKGHAQIDYQKCVGCDECVTVCPTEAIGIRWDTTGKQEMQEKMAEYAFGAMQGKRTGFINLLMDISPDCDCFPKSDAPIVPNIGILASRDPVAIDAASVDMVNKAPGLKNSRLKDPASPDKFREIHGFDNTWQLSYGEKIGLGSRKYKLIRL